MLAFQLSLVALFVVVAAWIDRENRRVNADNVRLRSARRRTASVLRRVKAQRDSHAEAMVGLSEELDAYHSERTVVFRGPAGLMPSRGGSA